MDAYRIFSVEGMSIVVMGAGNGIGKIVSTDLARAGAKVTILDVDRRAVDEAAEEIKKVSAEVLPITADVTSEDDLKHARDRIIDEFKSIDVIFNNAGVQVISPAERMSISDWQRVLDINLTGTFICCQVFGTYMISQRKGKIVNMASIHGLVGSGMHGAVGYNSSKAGVVNLTRSLAAEWGKYNINVNAIAPGLVKTKMSEKRMNDPKFLDELMNRLPLKNIVTPGDISAAVIFLSSEAGSRITGQTLVIDAGWLAHS